MYKITQLTMAQGTRPSKMYLRGSEGTVNAFYGVFVIQNDNENILIDTCISNEQYKDLSGRELENYTPIEEVLKDYPAIDKVILTHLHFDHVGNLPKFANLPIYVQKSELESANKLSGIDKHYNKSFWNGINFIEVDGDFELTNGVKLVLTPGHTKGTQSIIVDTKNGKIAIAGFCSVLENFRKDIPLGIFENSEEALNSLAKLKSVADGIYTVHDFGVMKVGE